MAWLVQYNKDLVLSNADVINKGTTENVPRLCRLAFTVPYQSVPAQT
jgi:hypothetical protein